MRNRADRAEWYAWLGMTYATRLAFADMECVGLDIDGAEPGSLWDRVDRDTLDRVAAVPVASERAAAWWSALGGEWDGWRQRCDRAAHAFRVHRVRVAAGSGEWGDVAALYRSVADTLTGHPCPAEEWDRLSWRVGDAYSLWRSSWSACAECGEVYDTDDMTTGNGERYCEGCADGMAECDGCGWYTAEDNLIHRECGNRCEECDRDRPRPWENYGHRPHPAFLDTDGSGLREVTPGRGAFFGIEWELDGGGETDPVARLVNDPDAWCYAKADGSLSDGVEIVTHPLTYAAARQWCAAAPVTDLAAGGWRADDTAGIHVHVSRRAFLGRSHLARFGLLIHGSELALRVAERPDRNPYYARRDGTAVVRRVRRSDAWGGRYFAVNYATPDLATVEVRLFGSTLTRDGLLARLETVHAAFTYTAGIGAAAVLVGALSDDAWSAWIADRADTYPTLAAMVAAV
jgi:hypothetical protein